VDEPALPSISDYWPVAPHRVGPPADDYTEDPRVAEQWVVTALPIPVTAPPADEPIPADEPSVRLRAVAGRLDGEPRRRAGRLASVLTALLLIGAAVVLVTLNRSGGVPDGSSAAPAGSRAAPTGAATRPPALAPNEVSAIAGDRTEARFELVSDVAAIRIRTAVLGDDLYRISTPADSSVLPKAEVGDAGVRLLLGLSGKQGDADVDVVLNARVRWSLRLTGGIRKGAFDLGDGKLDEVDFRGGATRLDLTLPVPDGTLPVRMSGGVNRFDVRTADGVPVRIRTRRGAGQVVLNGRTDDGVARGASFLSPGWARSADRIDLDAVAGVGTLRVGHE
jgi:hypothetical protein